MKYYLIATVLAFLFILSPSSSMGANGKGICEGAVQSKIRNENRNTQGVSFLRNTEQTQPHSGTRTTYNGNGNFRTSDGVWADFKWACDYTENTRQLSQVHYWITNQRNTGPAGNTLRPSLAPGLASPSDPMVRNCQDAIQQELGNQNQNMSRLGFRTPRWSPSSNQEKLLEGKGSFRNRFNQWKNFTYRCSIDPNGGVTQKSIIMR